MLFACLRLCQDQVTCVQQEILSCTIRHEIMKMWLVVVLIFDISNSLGSLPNNKQQEEQKKDFFFCLYAACYGIYICTIKQCNKIPSLSTYKKKT